MATWLQIALALAGVLVSCGVAYGVMRTAIRYLETLIDLLRADLGLLRGDVSKLSTQLADCDKRIAMVAVELNLGSRTRVGKN